MQPAATAAFVRVEETLLPPHEALLAAFLTAHAPGTGARLRRVGALALSLPALGVLQQRDRARQRRLAGLHLRGLSADRVELLAAELYDRALAGRVRREGLAVVERAARLGHRIVLVTSGLGCALEPLRARVALELDGLAGPHGVELVGSALEFRDGVATGKLLRPEGGRWVEPWSERAGVNLAASHAYGSDADDLPLLQAVGYACVVNPDARLRREAEAAGWPVLEVAAERAEARR